ncbi:type I restriction endonuclease [Geothrix fuzhouensis]|uniref:type I restriction endonuclease n=1 Tax=Geothrix fuzhouensis TaxID=2966451 RepID=UPI0021481C78|nr:type I restriction endonuclease [Geothrix fuzhouensis]
MDFLDQLRLIASRVPNQAGHLQTEEATKNALVLPFIKALGFDVFDPTEVQPELTADVGVKKGEKVDYAILRDGKPIIIMECKKYGTDLKKITATQLFRYFTVTETRFGVLTNGIHYFFYTDLDQPNMMDAKPFLEFNLLDFKDQDAEELKKFTKSTFDISNILSTATDLKYTKEIQRVLNEQLHSPSEEFVRLLAGKVYSGRMTQVVKDQFATLTKRAFQQLVNDKISDRLKVALADNGSNITEPVEPVVPPQEEEEKIITTPEEWEAFYIVRAILREVVEPKKVAIRDAQSYCAVLYDDNNRKPICRFYFNSKSKAVGVFDTQKIETRTPISDLTDLYQMADGLKAVATFHGNGKP